MVKTSPTCNLSIQVFCLFGVQSSIVKFDMSTIVGNVDMTVHMLLHGRLECKQSLATAVLDLDTWRLFLSFSPDRTVSLESAKGLLWSASHLLATFISSAV